MFLHEFGEDFVLALQLLFQEGDPPVLVVAGAAGAVLECGSGVLEELLLPTVEHRGVNAVLVAQIRHRGVFEEMEPKYGDLLRGAEAIPSFLGHGKTSARDCSLFERLVLPIPTEAKHDRLANRTRATVRYAAQALAALFINIVTYPPALSDMARAGWVKKSVKSTSGRLLQGQPAELRFAESHLLSYLIDVDRKGYSGTRKQDAGTYGSYRFYLWIRDNLPDLDLVYD